MASQKDITKTKLDLAPYQIILRPIATEKGYHVANTQNTYTFEVNPLASKTQIKSAIETLFEVKVVSVATQNRKGKVRKSRRSTGMTKSWKKALVTLDDKDRIDLF